jgi:hypothetical protein
MPPAEQSPRGATSADPSGSVPHAAGDAGSASVAPSGRASHHPLSSRPSLWNTREGLPLALLGLVALGSSAFGRLIAPAMFGAATGLDVWIMLTQAAANLLTQLAAVGGVVFLLRAVGATLSRSTLGIGYRSVMIPAAIATAVLTMAAAGRILEPQLGSALAISAVVAATLVAPVALYSPSSRAVGLVLALTALSGALHFAGLRLSASALESGSVRSYRVASGLATGGFVLELLLVALAFGWISARRRGHALALALVSSAFGLCLVWALRGGSDANASAFQVILARSVSGFLRAPAPFVPPALRLLLEAASVVGAVAALFATRRAPVAPVIALCLIARGSLDVPIPALLLVVAAISLPAHSRVGSKSA